jgi:hypothetical protein
VVRDEKPAYSTSVNARVDTDEVQDWLGPVPCLDLIGKRRAGSSPALLDHLAVRPRPK